MAGSIDREDPKWPCRGGRWPWRPISLAGQGRRCWLAISLVLVLVLPIVGCGAEQELPAGAAVTLTAERPLPVLLISLDGLRPDYLARAETPSLERLRQEGASADGLVQVFPTKTFTTHFSLVTGRYVDGHGVAANSMWDPDRKQRFSLRDRDAVMDPAWYDAEPIWVTAERQGLTAATFFWPGSEAPIGGSHPTYWRPYDASISHHERISQVLRWLDKPAAERPDLITLYLSHIDSTGHQQGPESDAVIRAVEAVDADLGLLLDGLAARELLGRMHVIVVSDHGMAAIDPERYILLDRLLPLAEVRVSDWGPAAHVWAQDMSVDAIMERLADAHPRMRVWRREDTPAHYGFSSHPRVADVIVEADLGWMISTRRYLAGQRVRPLRGMHGWDPLHRKMHGIWLAHGPAFAGGAEMAPVRGIHLYSLLAHLLSIQPAEHDGELGAWAPVLAAEQALSAPRPVTTPPVVYGARYPDAPAHTTADLGREPSADVRLQGELRRDCVGRETGCRFLLEDAAAAIVIDLRGLEFDALGTRLGPVQVQGDWTPPVLTVRSLLLQEPERLARQAIP